MTRAAAAAIAVAAVVGGVTGVARAGGAPIEAAIIIAAPAELPAIAARLAGQSFRTGDGVIIIDDVAAGGRPWTGVVERRGDALWLVTALGPLELTGPLARPRIAGPGYLIWVTGRREGNHLAATRIGILRKPVTAG